MGNGENSLKEAVLHFELEYLSEEDHGFMDRIIVQPKTQLRGAVNYQMARAFPRF